MQEEIIEQIEVAEETQTLEEVVEEKIDSEEQETEQETETKEDEVKIEIDYSQFDSLGTPEEVKTYLSGIINEDSNSETIEAVKKLLEKINLDSKTEEETTVQEEQRIESLKNDVMENLPISSKELIELQNWVNTQPKEYQEKVAELTDFRTKTKDEILKAIKDAYNERLNSSAKLPKFNASASTEGSLTREKVMDDYERIVKTYKGQEQKNKLEDLKSSVKMSRDSALKEWASYFFD